MTSRDLRRDQAERLKEQVCCQLRYLNRLTARMTQLGFPPGDPMYVAALRARDAMQDLHVAAHYATVDGGVG